MDRELVFQAELLAVGRKPGLLTQLDDLLRGVRLSHTILQLERGTGGQGELAQVEARARKARQHALRAAELAFFADAEKGARFELVRADSIEEGSEACCSRSRRSCSRTPWSSRGCAWTRARWPAS